MRDPERIDKVLKLLKKFWAKDGDARFFQLIYNLQRCYSISNDNVGEIPIHDSRGFKQLSLFDLYNVEDDDLIDFLETLLSKTEL